MRLIEPEKKLKPLTIEFTVEECQMLVEAMGRITGSFTCSKRKHSSALFSLLTTRGYGTSESTAAGGIHFKDG